MDRRVGQVSVVRERAGRMSRLREGDSVGLERGQMTEKGRVNVWQVSEVRKSGVRKSGVREREREISGVKVSEVIESGVGEPNESKWGRRERV